MLIYLSEPHYAKFYTKAAQFILEAGYETGSFQLKHNVTWP